jgi:hypothetical protein
MKDTIISVATKRRELWVLLGCFVAANITNIAAIIRFASPWYEVFTQVGYVLFLTCVLYLLLAVVRVAWRVCKHLLRR